MARVIGKRRLGLDVLRATAALTVVMAHGGLFFYSLWPSQQVLWLLASWGVDLFFALSGFLIGGILLDAARHDSRWIVNFWNRRWLRTLPNYFLFLLINLLLAWAALGDWPDVRLHLVFAQNLAWAPSSFFPESWSLAIEEVFYLLAPIVFLLFGVRAARPYRSLIVLILLVILAHWLRWQQIIEHGVGWHEGIKKIAIARVDAILYGVILALIVRWRALSERALTGLAAIAPILLFAAAFLFLRADADTDTYARLWCFSLSGLGFALLMPLCSAIRASTVEQWFTRAVRAMAAWSFALYLTHLPVMRIFDLLHLARDTWLRASALFVIYLMISIALAALVFRYFEAPILRWRDRRFPAVQSR